MVTYRGSRKHVLDLVKGCPESLAKLLHGTGAVLKHGWIPHGYDSPDETKLEVGCGLLPDEVCRQLGDWWLVHKLRANVPNWDLVCPCMINGEPGLLLVEAKANDVELKAYGKPLAADASQRSRENHESIGMAIAQARDALDRAVGGIRISRDLNYQLSNRVAFAWKIASLGTPTILMYLGFPNDAGIRDVGQPLADDRHWRELFWSHARTVLPESFEDRLVDCGRATMQFIVRSAEVTSPSPARRAVPLSQRTMER